MTFEAIAFDLDGTLVDSAGGVALALNTALHEADLPCFDLQRVRGWIGNGPDVLIERALRAIDLQDIDTAWLSARVRRNFDAMVLGLPFAECSIYAGVEELLEQLGRKNVPLAVITNTPTVLARAVLEEAGLLGYFTTVRGADTAALRMPSPLLIEQAATVLGTRPEHMLMIGARPVLARRLVLPDAVRPGPAGAMACSAANRATPSGASTRPRTCWFAWRCRRLVAVGGRQPERVGDERTGAGATRRCRASQWCGHTAGIMPPEAEGRCPFRSAATGLDRAPARRRCAGPACTAS